MTTAFYQRVGAGVNNLGPGSCTFTLSGSLTSSYETASFVASIAEAAVTSGFSLSASALVASITLNWVSIFDQPSATIYGGWIQQIA